jgi:hypothetical protein
MIDFLYTNGCSWTAGNGIEQDPLFSELPVHERWEKLTQLSWPNILAQRLGVPCQNDALGAASNQRMVRTTIDFLQNYKGDPSKLFIVLGWTTVDRNEIFLQEEDKSGWILFNSTQPVSSPGAHWLHGFSDKFFKRVDSWQKDYLIYIYSSYERYHEFFKELYLMKNLMENLGVKWVFFNTLRWRNFSFFWTRTPQFDPEKEFEKQIQNLRCPNMLNFDNDKNNVMELWCKNENVPMAADHHTMVEGHQRWADHLYDTIFTNIYPKFKHTAEL